MFGQTFDPGDLATIAVLIVLEGVLSIDNALVLGVLAGRLQGRDRFRALTYGLLGAFLLRVIVIATAVYLLHWSLLKLLGGAYLLWVGAKYFLFQSRRSATDRRPSSAPEGFWRTVAAIELTDLVFAVDSILAAVALVGPAPPQTPSDALHPKLWVIVTGGMLGVILMRFAAALFIYLLERLPRLGRSAYLLVVLIGLKLIADWGANTAAHPRRIDFQDAASPAFWIFWALVVICLGVGFIPLSDRRRVRTWQAGEKPGQ